MTPQEFTAAEESPGPPRLTRIAHQVSPAAKSGFTLAPACLLVLVLAFPACDPAGGKTVTSPTVSSPEVSSPTAKAEFLPGQPTFVAPTLEELEKLTWETRDLKSALASDSGLTLQNATLDLENSSPGENARIAAELARAPGAAADVDWDATLNRWLIGDPGNLNWLLASTRYQMDVLSVINMGPFSYDRNLNRVVNREVVVEWSSSADHLIDRVVLRDDLTWSDGTAFTAHDIEFSYRVIMDPRVPIPAVRAHVAPLKGVKAYDDRTVVYFHREPLVTNVWNLNFPVIPRHIYSRTLKDDPTMVKSVENKRLNREPVTVGPYRLVSWKPQDEIVVERREDWYQKNGKQIRKKPYLKTIRFHIITEQNAAMLAFRKGQLDEIELNPDLWKQATGKAFFARGTKVYGEVWSFFFIAWNQKPVPDAPFFKDRRVREAMSLAFPYREFLDEICSGLYQPASGIFHPNSWMGEPGLKPPEQDLARALKLLAEAGWEDTDGDNILDKEIDGKNVPFEFTLNIAMGSSLAPRVAALLQSALKRLGVVCQVKQLEAATFVALNSEHKFQATCLGWGSAVDPDLAKNIWTTGAHEDGRNYVGYSNPEVDRLFEEGARQFDPDKRAEIYRKINRLIMGDFPYTFLYFKTSFYAVSRDLRGFRLSPRGPFIYSPGILGLWKKKS